ncbi:putative integral membrane protein [Sphaerosporella brunnea]|uniref:Putative integral membrane protein n=1 Tax=Sphaerosporella brunnea TaxID=1250544 RepID=A0A5J5EGL0_9PEZI|nr:putative integral membrane protein [Sphaerosporella brunnea]
MTVPGDRSLSVRSVAGTFGVLAWISVSLRCYVRLKLVKNFGWDDGLMVVALGFYTILCACMVTASFYGTGQHEANLSEEHIVIAKRLWWFCELSYAFASMATKASICIFLLRITIRRTHRWILHSVMAMTMVTGIVFMLVLLLQCHPLTYFWDKNQPGHCIDWSVVIAMSWLWSGFAGLCDFTVGILPIFIVWNLNRDRRTKIAVVGILGIACIASSATIIRMPFLHTFADPDWLWATTDIALWTDIEVGLGIFASCLATLRPLFILVARSRSQRGLTDNYQHSGRLPPNNHPFKHNFIEQGVDGAQMFRPQNMGITLTTVHAGYDGNGSDELLTQPPQIHNPRQEYRVHRTFGVTTVESVPLERV